MPRANRWFMQGYVWHITHRRDRRKFLLKFARDRNRWLYWLFEAKRRLGLCVLNYIVTSNHIHLLVRDRGDGEIVVDANSELTSVNRYCRKWTDNRKHFVAQHYSVDSFSLAGHALFGSLVNFQPARTAHAEFSVPAGISPLARR